MIYILRLLPFTFLLAFACFFYGCDTEIPKMDISFWAGDSQQAGISRSQEHRTISCGTPEFDQYACLTYTDIMTIFNALTLCQEWPDSVKTVPVRTLKKKYPEVQDYLVQGQGR